MKSKLGEVGKDLAGASGKESAEADAVGCVAGSELDAAVAIRVMGWLAPGNKTTKTMREQQRMTHSAYDGYYLTPLGELRKPLPYSTDIAAAMEVESRIEELNLENDYIACLWDVIGAERNSTFWTADNVDAFWKCIHATAEQRCRAALRATASAAALSTTVG